MTSPFDWKNQPSKINMKDIVAAAKSSYQATFVVNSKRKKGVEPTGVTLPGSQDTLPERFAIDMPVMPVNSKTMYKRRKKNGN